MLYVNNLSKYIKKLKNSVLLVRCRKPYFCDNTRTLSVTHVKYNQIQIYPDLFQYLTQIQCNFVFSFHVYREYNTINNNVFLIGLNMGLDLRKYRMKVFNKNKMFIQR